MLLEQLAWPINEAETAKLLRFDSSTAAALLVRMCSIHSFIFRTARANCNGCSTFLLSCLDLPYWSRARCSDWPKPTYFPDSRNAKSKQAEEEVAACATATDKLRVIQSAGSAAQNILEWKWKPEEAQVESSTKIRCNFSAAFLTSFANWFRREECLGASSKKRNFRWCLIVARWSEWLMLEGEKWWSASAERRSHRVTSHERNFTIIKLEWLVSQLWRARRMQNAHFQHFRFDLVSDDKIY